MVGICCAGFTDKGTRVEDDPSLQAIGICGWSPRQSKVTGADYQHRKAWWYRL
jgi:hypothetical protein